MIENREVMARNIKYYMDKKGVNASEVCEALDIKHNTFSDWVNAKNYPRIDSIERMAKYFGVNKAFLVEDISEIEIFTDEEKSIILAYRNADQITQESVKRLLEYAKRMYGEKEDGNR